MARRAIFNGMHVATHSFDHADENLMTDSIDVTIELWLKSTSGGQSNFSSANPMVTGAVVDPFRPLSDLKKVLCEHLKLNDADFVLSSAKSPTTREELVSKNDKLQGRIAYVGIDAVVLYGVQHRWG